MQDEEQKKCAENSGGSVYGVLSFVVSAPAGVSLTLKPLLRRGGGETKGSFTIS